MNRERQMNARVSQNGDDTEWHQHQYVMASTGNVDSARICPGPPGRLNALRVSRSKSVLHGAFVGGGGGAA